MDHTPAELQGNLTAKTTFIIGIWVFPCDGHRHNGSDRQAASGVPLQLRIAARQHVAVRRSLLNCLLVFRRNLRRRLNCLFEAVIRLARAQLQAPD